MENAYNVMLGALEKSVISILDADPDVDKRDLLAKSLGQFGEAFAETIVADIDQAYATGAEEGYGVGAEDAFGKAAEDGFGLDLRKGFDHIAAFAAVLHAAQQYLQSLEADVGDDETSHDALDAIDQWVQMGAEILHMMSGDHAAAGDEDAQDGGADDAQESDAPPPARKDEPQGDLAKEEQGQEDREGVEADAAEALAKAETELAKAELAKADAELAKRDATISKLSGQIEGLAKALDDIKARPAPTAASIRVVGKDNESELGKHEGGGARAAELTKMAEALPDGEGKVLALTKAALAQPRAFTIG